MKRRHLAAAVLGLALPLLTGCRSDESLNSPDLANNGALLERYVSMGNSITAGFQSAGINDSTQLQSYAVLLAAQMGTPFFPPLLNRPGCPPPFTNAFLQQRVGGGTGTTCFLRKIPTIPPPYVTNVAVPGAYVFDPLSNFAGTSHPNQLTTLFLGGLSQIEAAHRVDPTFVSFWLGNNDVLGAATDLANAGNPAEVTDTSVFKATLHAALDSLANPKEAPSLKGAILIGAANVTEIPFFNTGSTYFGIKNTTTNFPATFIVLPNCAPASLAGQGDSTLIPWPLGAALIGAAAAGATDTLDCSSDRYVQPAELDNLLATVNSYNAAIS